MSNANDGGRDPRLAALSREQYRVLRESGTETPFANAYWDRKEPGIYVDPITGLPLFLSADKYDSGTGWPSFTRPAPDAPIEERTDDSHGMRRTEVRSASSDSHLGHVFTDGLSPEGGRRYCINSAALRFVPRTEMAREGYSYLLSALEETD